MIAYQMLILMQDQSDSFFKHFNELRGRLADSYFILLDFRYH